MANWVLFTAALWLLAVLEDRELAARFGAEYEEYARPARAAPVPELSGEEGGTMSEIITAVAGVPALDELPPRVQEALVAFQQALLTVFPGQIRRVILYGSYARGDAAPDSDVDVMVVVAWEEERLPSGFYRSMYGDPRWERIVDLATDVNLDFGIYISPMVISQSRFEEWSPLMYCVRREGVELWSMRD